MILTPSRDKTKVRRYSHNSVFKIIPGMSTLDFLPSFLPYSAESVSADPSKQGVKFQLKPSDIPGTALGLLLMEGWKMIYGNLGEGFARAWSCSGIPGEVWGVPVVLPWDRSLIAWDKSMIPAHPWLCFWDCLAGIHFQRSPAGSQTFGSLLKQADVALFPKFGDV